MSLKTAVFRKVIGRPLNTHNFVVHIPAISGVHLLVSGTSFPTEKLGGKKLFFQGEPISFPTYPNRGGTWSCTFSESEYAKVYRSSSLEFNLNFNQALGVLNYLPVFTKFNMWVGVHPMSDDRSSIEKFLSMGTGLFSVTMVGCYLLGMEPVRLDNKAATTSWSWTLSFSYDSLIYNPALPNRNPDEHRELPKEVQVDWSYNRAGSNELLKQNPAAGQVVPDFSDVNSGEVYK